MLQSVKCVYFSCLPLKLVGTPNRLNLTANQSTTSPNLFSFSFTFFDCRVAAGCHNLKVMSGSFVIFLLFVSLKPVAVSLL